ncbi:hypothetical protein A2875_04500 [Candidatus Gottesmanbacteria bacterium RIFCSPHIGHO2_01_FULL_46_14]|uniref:tetrahydrofolate synthase n=1 Tax=Candidatus Gottesmanbacteria bacterium RIFCSPHIGHO2_01_FULL_46_14 TaxID=1798380 RepID=A0A1F5ZJL2_9BACT|nr:MAG: hypothetical protein A2875_04500 [Candidatus Gottesmanbacteria bacterium RIFCSPHIGHO2_01_FULL_46_14]
MESFTSAQAYLERHFSSGKTYSLERIRSLLSDLKSPHLAVPTIHVGGTAGKGSTSFLIASILEHAGYRVGLYTSPHLISITERITIDRTPITESAFVAILESIKSAIPQGATYFEIITAMTFAYFAREHVDVAIVEVGVGGKLDCTNVVDPRVSVITNVGLDHTEILGETIEDISRDKREIIKPKKPVISGVTQPQIRDLIIEKAASVDAPLFLAGRDFHIKNLTIGRPIVFDYVSPEKTLSNLELSLLGRHQVVNAAVAITAVFQSGFIVTADAIRKALSTASYPGRMEVMGNIIIDGAHNPMKIQALSNALTDHFPGVQFETLFAVKGDKNAFDMVRTLAPFVSHWYLTTLEALTDWGKGQMLPVNALEKTIKEADPGKPVSVVEKPEEFLQNPPPPTLITGSLYLVGAVEKWISGSRT